MKKKKQNLASVPPAPAAKNVGGRPAWQPDPGQLALIKALASVGLPVRQIAAIFNKSEITLRKHCLHELVQGGSAADHQVVQSLFDMATDKKHPRVTMFWARARCGFADGNSSEYAALYKLHSSTEDPDEIAANPSDLEWPEHSGIVCMTEEEEAAELELARRRE